MKRYWARVVDGIVTEVIVADDSITEEARGIALAKSRGGDWYITDKNAWYGQPKDGETPVVRGTFAGAGYGYDATNDTFFPPMPREVGDWLFSPERHQWESV